MRAQLPSDLFTRADCAARGIHPQTLARLLSTGAVRRLLCGTFIAADVWDEIDEDARRRLRVQAALRRRPQASASHTSALVLLELPLVVEPEQRVDVVDEVRQTVRRSGVWVHPRPWLAAQGSTVGPALAVAQTASLGWRSTAVAAADAALHVGMTTLEAMLAAAAVVPCPALARETVLLADGRMESPGESLTRLALLDLGCQVEPQVVFRAEGQQFRVDFLVTHRRWPGVAVIVEFDGQVKYANSSDGAVLFAEKQREDLLRRSGHPVVRVVWSDLMRRDVFPARLARAFNQHVAA